MIEYVIFACLAKTEKELYPELLFFQTVLSKILSILYLRRKVLM